MSASSVCLFLFHLFAAALACVIANTGVNAMSHTQYFISHDNNCYIRVLYECDKRMNAI